MGFRRGGGFCAVGGGGCCVGTVYQLADFQPLTFHYAHVRVHEHDGLRVAGEVRRRVRRVVRQAVAVAVDPAEDRLVDVPQTPELVLEGVLDRVRHARLPPPNFLGYAPFRVVQADTLPNPQLTVHMIKRPQLFDTGYCKHKIIKIIVRIEVIATV